MEEIYRQHKIGYYENVGEAGTFYTGIGNNERYESDSLQAVKNFIDKEIKKEFKRTPVYYYDDEWDITSVDEQGNAWAVSKQGDRRKFSKYGLNSVYLRTPENDALMAQIKKVREDIRKLNDEEREIRAKMVVLKIKDVKE